MLEENASDIKSVLEKRVRFLKENAEELAIILQRKARLMNHKSYILDCGAKDQKATRKLE
jgi:hypothetical protein